MSSLYTLRMLRKPCAEEKEALLAFSDSLMDRYGVVEENMERIADAFPLLFEEPTYRRIKTPRCGKCSGLTACVHCDGEV